MRVTGTSGSGISIGFLGLLELREGLLSFSFCPALGLFAFALALSLPVMQFAMRDQLLYKGTSGTVGPVGPCSISGSLVC